METQLGEVKRDGVGFLFGVSLGTNEQTTFSFFWWGVETNPLWGLAIMACGSILLAMRYNTPLLLSIKDPSFQKLPTTD